MKEEEELKIAETAFDSFLQENDRLSMEAQKKYISKLLLYTFNQKNLLLKELSLRQKSPARKMRKLKEEMKKFFS